MEIEKLFRDNNIKIIKTITSAVRNADELLLNYPPF